MTLVAPERTAPAPAVPMPHRAGPLSLGHMAPAEAWKFAEALANTPLLPDAYRKQPASVLWAMEYGRALGLDVVTTITTIHVIKGKPTQSADLMLSRAREAGHRVRVKPERDRCVVAIQRHDDPDDETVIEWTLDDAVTACLCEMRNGRPYARDQHGKPSSWEKYPRAMLRSRAIAEAVRTACPEVLHGAIYTPEELGAVVDQEGNAVVVERADAPVMQTATVVQSTPNPAPADEQRRDFIVEAMASTDEAALDALVTAAAEAGAPDWYRVQLDDLREAQLAADAAAVRKLHTAAQANGAPAEHLARIVQIGQGKPGANPTPSTAGSGTTADAATERATESPRPDLDDVTDAAGEASWQGEPARQAAAEAENRLRLAASRANLPELDDTFARVYGIPIEQATAQQLDHFRTRIEAAGGVQ